MDETSLGWSLFVTTMHQIFEILEELLLDENITDKRKESLEKRLQNRREKLSLIIKIGKAKHNKTWKLPIIIKEAGNA